MINVIKATEIMRKYCPETKLEIKNGADGLYLTESDIIWIGRDWHLGGLLHEITHAMLYKEDGRTGHDGVFADRLTQLVGEVFCNHISQQEKKVSLTEQWKNGELEEGAYYYIKINNKTIPAKLSKYGNFYLTEGACGRNAMRNVEEVLAEVPSYEEWKNITDTLDYEYKGNLTLREENDKLKELLSKCVSRVDTLSDILDFLKDKVVYKQSKQLADMLKSTREIIKEIDEVLK